MERGDVRTALARGDFVAAVDADIAEARSLRITGVPFYLFDHTHAVSGAQPPDTFTKLLRTLYAEKHVEH